MAHQRIQAAHARKDFANIVARSSKGERIKVTRYGRTLAGIVPKRDLEKLDELDAGGSPRPRSARAGR